MNSTFSDTVAATWGELGVQVCGANNAKVFVRTEVMPEKIGMIYLPPSKTTFYGENLGSKQWNMGVVLSIGGKCDTVKPGDRVCFQRFYFARYNKMSDNTMVGWVDESDIVGLVEE